MIDMQNPVEKMQPRTLNVSDIPDAIHLVRSVIMKSALDCECRDKVDAALQQLEAFEQQRNQAKLLAMAREERRKIGILLDMLGDFAEDDEMDSGIIEAASLLFADIAAAAQEGSRILKEITSPETCI
ncbi:hypothetical protein [Agrobacterium sp. Azo12]|uniref:hypothetical protein n=1 Tax=Agrobacterium sp. Azo12 TaxID=3031129 RepID=UPI0023D8AFEC|nr:hypothetical protein [Agrobacterium sp. Azo12]MDO5896925.1 hypothetical protein [Agrobacterium sp. Azo12]